MWFSTQVTLRFVLETEKREMQILLHMRLWVTLRVANNVDLIKTKRAGLGRWDENCFSCSIFLSLLLQSEERFIMKFY